MENEGLTSLRPGGACRSAGYRPIESSLLGYVESRLWADTTTLPDGIQERQSVAPVPQGVSSHHQLLDGACRRTLRPGFASAAHTVGPVDSAAFGIQAAPRRPLTQPVA